MKENQRSKLTAFFMLPILCLCGIQIAWAGDTQGKVSKVALRPYSNNAHTMQIYFSTIESDRWGCLAGQGYIAVTDASPYITEKSFDRILSMAIAAQTSGKSLAIDSPGTDPCDNGNMAWLLN